MGAKLHLIEEYKQPGVYHYYCPGCKGVHNVWTQVKNSKDAIWQWNGSMEKPTFSPSLLLHYTYGPQNTKYICHVFIRDGMIQFLGDCTHELKNQTVAMPDIEPYIEK